MKRPAHIPPRSTKHTNTPVRASFFEAIPVLPALLTILLIGYAVYSNSFECTFQFDDEYNILDNKVIRTLSPGKIWDYNRNRFLPNLSFAWNYSKGGFETMGYHQLNLAIHLINALLVYWLSILVFASPALEGVPLARYRKNIALFTALLFVAHPLATQSVTYIVQRIASMAALFYFLSAALYIHGRLSQHSIRRYLSFGGAVLSMLAAIHCKENAYSLPLAILWIEICLFRTGQGSILKKKQVWFAAAVLVVAAFIVLQRFSLDVLKPVKTNMGTSYSISSSDYLLTQFGVIVKYIQLLILPINQNLDYDWPISKGLSEPVTLLSLLLLAALLVLAFYHLKRNRMISFCIGWFFITLSIESSFIPIGDVIFEHRTYLPSLGLLLLLSGLLYRYPGQSRPGVAFLILLLVSVTFGVMAHRRNKVWKDPISLYTDTVKKSPGKARPWASLADEYADRSQWDQAIECYDKAIAINPRYSLALHNRGLMHYNKKMLQEARADYTRAIEVNSTYTKAYYNRAIVLNELGLFREAIDDNSRVMQLDPSFVNAYSGRGGAYSSIGDFEKAVDDYTRVIRKAPETKNIFTSRGYAYSRLNRTNDAIADYTMAISMDSTDAKAYFNRAVLLNAGKRQAEAMKDYDNAIIHNPRYASAFINRGNLFYQAGAWQRALDDFDSALAIEPGNAIALQNRRIVLTKIGAPQR